MSHCVPARWKTMSSALAHWHATTSSAHCVPPLWYSVWDSLLSQCVLHAVCRLHTLRPTYIHTWQLTPYEIVIVQNKTDSVSTAGSELHNSNRYSCCMCYLLHVLLVACVTCCMCYLLHVLLAACVTWRMCYLAHVLLGASIN